MKRFLITVDTNWVGTQENYTAIVEHESDLYDFADNLAYDNFIESNGFESVLEELFPAAEEFTQKMEEEAEKVLHEYYNSSVEEWDEEYSDEKDWNLYNLIRNDLRKGEFLYKIYAGLGGGFGGSTYIETEVFSSLEEAEKAAYEYAIEEYESMEGMHGLRSYEQILEELIYEYGEDDISSLENEAEQIYNEEMESWLDYHVELVAVGHKDDISSL